MLSRVFARRVCAKHKWSLSAGKDRFPQQHRQRSLSSDQQLSPGDAYSGKCRLVLDGLTSRTIIEHSSVKAELKVCCSLSPLPPSLIFVCFHSSSPVFDPLLCVLWFSLSLLSPQRSVHPHFICSCPLYPSSSSPSSTSSLSPPSLNLVELLSPPSLPSLFAEHLWHPPESLGQSRIHAERVTSSPDSRELWGICLLMT